MKMFVVLVLLGWTTVCSSMFVPHYEKEMMEGSGGGGDNIGLWQKGLIGPVMEKYWHYPKYHFDYGVQDFKTGDIKKQWEVRDGDVVKGGYMLVEPDGTTRVVEYYADSISGFNAKVKTIGVPNQVHYEPKFILGMGASSSMGSGSEQSGGFSYSNQVLHH